MNILHNSSPNSSSRPATNQRNAMKRAEENASGKALDFEQELCNICICLGHLHTSYAVEGDGAKVMVRTVYTVLRALPRLLHRLHLRCTDRRVAHEIRAFSKRANIELSRRPATSPNSGQQISNPKSMHSASCWSRSSKPVMDSLYQHQIYQRVTKFLTTRVVKLQSRDLGNIPRENNWSWTCTTNSFSQHGRDLGTMLRKNMVDRLALLRVLSSEKSQSVLPFYQPWNLDSKKMRPWLRACLPS